MAGSFARKQNAAEQAGSHRTKATGSPTAARDARHPVLHPLLTAGSRDAAALSPLLQFIGHDTPLAREAPRLPYDLPTEPVRRQSPPVLQARPSAGTPGDEAEKEADSVPRQVVQHTLGDAVIQRTPAPGPKPAPAGAKPGPTAPMSGSGGGEYGRVAREVAGSSSRPTPEKLRIKLVSILQERKKTEIDIKLQAFQDDKKWRADFYASIKKWYQEIHELSVKLDKLNAELREILDEWYIFEYEPTKWTIRKLDDVWKRIALMYWDIRHKEEAEKAYEQEADKTEKALLREQSTLQVTIQRFDKAGASMSKSEFDSLAARLTQLSGALDQLRNEELKAQVRFTGSGPVSRPE